MVVGNADPIEGTTCHDNGHIPYLPVEILQLVVLQLRCTVRPPADREKYDAFLGDCRIRLSTLASCMRVNLEFRRFTRPILYHALDARVLSLKKNWPLWRFAALLARDPAMCAMVKEIHLDISYPSAHSPKPSPPPDALAEAWTTLLTTARQMPQLTAGLRESIVDGMETGFLGPEHTLIWALCPQIKVLSFDLSEHFQGFSEMVFELAGQAKPTQGSKHAQSNALANVQEVIIGYPGIGDPEYECLSPAIAPSGVFALPRLERYTGYLCDKAAQTLGQIHWSSSLTYLNVETWDLEARAFCSVLQACPNLRTLLVKWIRYWRINHSSGQERMQNPLRFDIYASSLAAHASRLETLRFDTSGFIDKWRIKAPELTSSLASLSQLKNLTVPIETVLDNDNGESDSDENIELDNSDQDEESGEDDEPSTLATAAALPLTELLPSSLRTLKVIDDWAEESDAERLDSQLRFIMSEERFAELRSMRVRRAIAFDEGSVPNGWDLGGNRQWVVLQRLG